MMIQAQNFFTRVGYLKILVLSFLALIVGFVFGGIILPKIIKEVMKMQLRLTPGSQTRPLFEKVPFPLEFRVYIFNVTNKDEIMQGGKPKLQEIGPYYFEEWKDKFDVVDNKEDDTIEYDFRNTYRYVPEKNGPGLTGDEIVTVANPLLLALALSINVDREELLPFIHNAINGLLHNPTDIFYTGRVWDLLYDGIMIDCSSDDYEVGAVCSEFDSGEYAEIGRLNETTFTFSFFGNSNGTGLVRYTALRGKKNIGDMGRIVKYNDLEVMDAWYEDECNEVYGTDGTIYAPFRTNEEGYDVFVPQMCQVLHAHYVGTEKVRGVTTSRFVTDFDTSKFGIPNCYCRDPEKCAPKGLLDLTPCTGTPIAVSAPHFYDADPALLEMVEGLHPEEEKHDFFFNFYQFAGAPIKATVRAQINFEVVPIEEITIMKDLPSVYFPVLWFEDEVNVDKKLLNMLKYQLILGLKLQKLTKYAGIIVGIIGMIFGSIACYFQMENDGTRPLSDQSHRSNKSLDNPQVQTIEVMSNE